MTRLLPVAIAATLGLSAPGVAQEASRPRSDAPRTEAVKLVLVGDSTMAPASGWGSMFCARHVKSSVACLNLARGGRSTRSYRQEGSWDVALAEARTPGYRKTYVLIQFAHNDQSSEPERWTERETEFPANLRRFVTEVRSAGAEPVLLTPLTRREFRNGQLQDSLAPWAAAIRSVGAELKVPVVDVHSRSMAAVRSLGAVQSLALAQAEPNAAERAAAGVGTTLKARPAAEARLPDVPTTPTGPRAQVQRKFDYTHVGDAGAAVFARLVAQDLAAAVPALRSQLVP